MTDSIDFTLAFHALTDHDPFPWQEELYGRLLRNDMPSSCDIPTGLGKTAVIPIWLIALASCCKDDGPPTVPRRLVYVVNRRTVVDQSTVVVEKMRERLLDPDRVEWAGHKEVLGDLRERLQRLAATDDLPLAVSTLRGQLADNREWCSDPTRPAVILGTVDMIGSRLLFSGYGCGFKTKPLHAGFLGQDALLVHDEAHLEPAFQELLVAIQKEQKDGRTPDPWPLRIMELTATSRGQDGPPVFTDEERNPPDVVPDPAMKPIEVVWRRLKAKKMLKPRPVSDEKQVAPKMLQLALHHKESSKAILVFGRTVKAVEDIRNGLIGKDKMPEENVLSLTGTLRALERDELVKKPVFQRFLPESNRDQDAEMAEGTVYLVCTSAGEVGVDISADHMVCDLSTLESMIQRLGRVNRFGKGDAKVTVVNPDSFDAKSDLDSARERTLDVLKRLPKRDGGYDASPASLTTMLDNLTKDEKEAAFSPQPDIPPATDILFDAWALTTIREKLPGRPPVEPYLHGISDYDPPQTYVAWREEVTVLGKSKVDEEELSNWFHACPIVSCERLREKTSEVKRNLGKLLAAHRKNKKQTDFDSTVVVLDERGNAESSTLSKIIEKNFNLDHRIIVLPVEVAGLDRQGMLNPELNAKKVEPNDQLDVAELQKDDNRRERWRLIEDGGEKTYRSLATGEAVEELPPSLREAVRIVLRQSEEGAEDEGGGEYLLLMVPPKQQSLANPESARFYQTLEDHAGKIVEHAKSIVDRLHLDGSLKEAIVQAARLHDHGKGQSVWQRYACNKGQPLVAKSPRYIHWQALGGYRHEFGSLLEAARDGQIKGADRDLILHLIAAHHGWARPHFTPRAGSNAGTTAENEQMMIEVMQRFGRLQQQFGRWGLAYLESLVRAADALASRPPNATTKEGRS